MSFFEKLKSIHGGPPAPPKRIENNAGDGGWPEDEFDADDTDTYEAPPCERPVMKVPPRPVEENVYLERTSEKPNPGHPKRQTPPPRPAKITPIGKTPQPNHRAEDPGGYYIDPNTKKPPEVDRKEKPAMWSTSKKVAPPPLRPAPAPAPLPPTAEEDVYLDPNEGQEDSDDLYLEPEAACSPAPRSPMRTPFPPKTPAVPMHLPLKPPVPRTFSTSVLISQTMTASPPGVKTAMLAEKEDKEWFAGHCDRKTAEDLLLRINKDGAFLIRHSSAQNARQPYTLAVLFRQKVYNIPIRFLEETRSYALGKEGKKNEEVKKQWREGVRRNI